jgi:hypothetical protein
MSTFIKQLDIKQLDLSPTLIKAHPNYKTLRDYGIIAD